ncbi:hypothetical protein DEH69_07575 [Streptomyces sp. PT12]|nr:hypothetical protein DEH69_07575 [Streptomyces sp. PT12]
MSGTTGERSGLPVRRRTVLGASAAAMSGAGSYLGSAAHAAPSGVPRGARAREGAAPAVG